MSMYWIKFSISAWIELSDWQLLRFVARPSWLTSLYPTLLALQLKIKYLLPPSTAMYALSDWRTTLCMYSYIPSVLLSFTELTELWGWKPSRNTLLKYFQLIPCELWTLTCRYIVWRFLWLQGELPDISFLLPRVRLWNISAYPASPLATNFFTYKWVCVFLITS